MPYYYDTEMQIRETFSKNVKKYMFYKRISQRELARRAGISETTLSRILNCLLTPGIKSIVNLSLALDVKVDKLLYL